MHLSSLDKMKYFRDNYLKGKELEKLTILDLGSQDVNGTYKSIFNEPNWTYIGADAAPGKNVDLVLADPYCWRELKNANIDILISGQAFEHIEFFWLTILEVSRVLKPNGLCCIIAPSSGQEHRYPVDCWRFYPDGFAAMARFAKLDLLEVYTQWSDEEYADGSDEWHDTILVARNGNLGLKQRLKRRIHHYLLSLALKFS